MSGKHYSDDDLVARLFGLGSDDAHLAECEECTRELALYRRLVVALEAAPFLAPRAALTARILDRVLPDRVRRRRRIAILGGSYAAAFVALAGAFAVWVAQPGGRAALEMVTGRVSQRLVALGISVVNSLGSSAVRLAEGWGLVHAAGGWLAPLTRALATVLTAPGIVITVWAAAASCAALRWWMRPRTRAAAREVRHVGILGF